MTLTGILLFGAEESLDLLADFTLGKLDIVLSGTIVGHEGQEAIVSDVELVRTLTSFPMPTRIYASSYQLIFTTADVRDLHVVGGWGEILHLLASENVESDQVDLGVTVLPSLGGGHLDDLAWAALDDNEAVLSQGGTLHGIGGRGTGIGRLEGVLMLMGISMSAGHPSDIYRKAIQRMLEKIAQIQVCQNRRQRRGTIIQVEAAYLRVVVFRHVED